MPSGKKILITGGAGFIGSHLAEALAESNFVTSLDNYFTGSRDNHVAGVQYLEGHTRDIDKIIETPPEIVYHLGEYSRVERSFAEPDVVWDLNVQGTTQVVEYCRRVGAKLVYAGSSTKFASGDSGRDLSPYTWSKAINSELIVNYGAWYGIDYAITYFYNVYGPREICSGTYATVLGIFRALHEQGKPLTVVSPGTQQRNFTHVLDVVRGLLIVGDHGHGDGFGLGADASYTIVEIAEMFGSEIAWLPERPGNRKASRLDTSKARLLGWNPTQKVEDYVARAVSSSREAK